MNALIRTIVITGLLLAGAVSSALAQPEQWRVQDGGNGHWYQGVLLPNSGLIDWAGAKAAAEQVGGHLVTITSAAESTFITSHSSSLILTNAWIGGYQDTTAPDYSEPAGGWRWVTGEPWQFTNWEPGEPNNSWACGENHAEIYGNGRWNDFSCGQGGYIIEWEADCNGDGIVDKGQTLSGQLADANGNGIPDICEMPAGAVGWTHRTDGGPAADPGGGMAYDSARGVTVLFGGGGGCPSPRVSGDTWEWNGTIWAQRMVSGPLPRFDHAMAYDASRGVTVLFGGYVQSLGSQSGETWEWNGSAWTLRASSGPSARSSFGMAYDSARGVTVLFGGGAQGGWSGETWEWNGTAWTQRMVSGPSQRGYASMAYDSARHVTVLFGGYSYDSSAHFYADSWEWSGTAWTQRTVSGPTARSGQVMAYDSARGVTVLFGGFSNGLGTNNETWDWNGTVWTQRVVNGPSPRTQPAMAYDAVRGMTVLFGGAANCDVFDGDTWELGVPCTSPSIASQPAARTVCPGGSGSFTVAAAGTTPTYQWQIEAAPGNWVTLTGTPQPLIFCGPSTPGMAFASQPTSATTSISALGCHGVQRWNIRAVVTNACGSVNSAPVVLSICPADYNCNGAIEVADIFAFLNGWFAGSPNADFDGVNGLQVADIFAFLNAWFTGCP